MSSIGLRVINFQNMIRDTNDQNTTETAISQSFLLSAAKCLEMPKYFTPKEVINKIKIEQILINPKFNTDENNNRI